MKIQTQSTPLYNPLEKPNRSAEESSASPHFSTLFQQMAQARSSGSASAEPESSAESLGIAAPEAQKSAFHSWLASRQAQGAGPDYLDNLNQQTEAFEALIDKAYAANAYKDPQAFLKSLSTKELHTLQQVNSLAEPIATGRLSQEGALNLLLPPNQRKDLDKNGFVMVGEAKTWCFPPVDAPAEIKKAWDQAVAESGNSDLTMQGFFLPSPFQDNAYLGQNVKAYLDLTSQRINAAKEAQKLDFPWQQENRKKQIAFLNRFLELLELTDA